MADQEAMTKMRATGTGFLASQVRVREGEVFMYPTRFIVYEKVKDSSGKETGEIKQIKPTWAEPFSEADIPKDKKFNIPGMKQKTTVLSRRDQTATPAGRKEVEADAPVGAATGRPSDESVI